MSKLRLRLDTLMVESFDTTAMEAPRGTVFGEQCSCPTNCPTCEHTCAYTCDDATCPACPTCAASCNGTCDGGGTCYASCYGTCEASCNGTCFMCPNTSLAFPCYLDP